MGLTSTSNIALVSIPVHILYLSVCKCVALINTLHLLLALLFLLVCFYVADIVFCSCFVYIFILIFWWKIKELEFITKEKRKKKRVANQQ